MTRLRLRRDGDLHHEIQELPRLNLADPMRHPAGTIAKSPARIGLVSPPAMLRPRISPRAVATPPTSVPPVTRVPAPSSRYQTVKSPCTSERVGAVRRMPITGWPPSPESLTEYKPGCPGFSSGALRHVSAIDPRRDIPGGIANLQQRQPDFPGRRSFHPCTTQSGPRLPRVSRPRVR